MQITGASTIALTERAAAEFEHRFGRPPAVALAPGRVNLVGEHTDYNDGFVLPLAIDRYMAAAFAPRKDRTLHVHALDLDDSATIDLDDLDATPTGSWSRYVAAVAWALETAGETLTGADLLLHGDIPVGAGLSSSAALELAVMRALAAASGVDWDPEPMARLAQRAENEFVGVACGIMDQFVAAVPRTPGALLLDCRSLAYEHVELPEEAVVYVLDTGVRRRLTNGVYDERVRQCREALAIVQREVGPARALRDVSPEALEATRPAMPDVLYRRAKHVVEEILRPARMAQALRAGDLDAAGEVMLASHSSLRDLYEVSSPELDHAVEQARAHEGCYGARLTGAGLGGCAVALVHRDAEADFADWIAAAYRKRFSHPSAFYVCRPAMGAHLV